MTPDQIEAENKKYGMKRFQVIPLSSGLFAITDAAYQVKTICRADEILLSGIDIIETMKLPNRVQIQITLPPIEVDLDL